MSETIRRLVQSLYPEQADETTAQILSLMDSARDNLPQRHCDDLFSERDVVLITYGDTLYHEGESPLETLHQFAVEHIQSFISTIHLLPFYPYSSDDGFSVQDFYAVNPDVGDWSHVEALSQDFDLMFDAVFNHMSAQSDWFRQFLAGEAAFQELFRTEDPDTDLSAVTRPRATPLLTAFERPGGDEVHVWTTFSADQVDFDVRHPSTLLRLLAILFFYIEKGARIIRLDAIAYLWKTAGTSSIHLTETHQVIQLMRAVLDEIAPCVVLITETNVPHAENVSYFGDGQNEAQMVYNFTLPPLLFHTLLTGDVSRLCDWINTLSTPSDRTTFFNFTASHDGIGVRPVEGILSSDELQQMIAHAERSGGQVSYKQNSDGSQSPYELNVTFVDALINPDESRALQVRRFMLSQAIAMSLAGVPAVYIHSLLGSRNDLAGVQRTGRARSINRARLHVDTLSAQISDSEHFRAQVFTQYAHLLTVRTQQPAFHPNASQEALHSDVPGVLLLRRTAQSGEQLLCVYHVRPLEQTLSLADFVDDTATDVLTGESIGSTLTLAPYSYYWLRL